MHNVSTQFADGGEFGLVVKLNTNKLPPRGPVGINQLTSYKYVVSGSNKNLVNESFQNKPIGILGGSFDPPHIGHVKISKIALKKLSINKLYWVITKKNPHKSQPFFN